MNTDSHGFFKPKMEGDEFFASGKELDGSEVGWNAGREA